MMRFRYIDIPRLVFQFVRSNFATRSDYDAETQPIRTTYIYRLCLCICFLFRGNLKDYYRTRSKQYMIAACTPTYGQIERVLNYWYNSYGGEIYWTRSQASVEESYLYTEANPPVYFYRGDTPPVYLGRGGNYTEMPIIHIPQALYTSTDYSQFIADLNLLLPFWVSYIVEPFTP